jgi:hypothetical protein
VHYKKKMMKNDEKASKQASKQASKKELQSIKHEEKKQQASHNIINSYQQ